MGLAPSHDIAALYICSNLNSLHTIETIEETVNAFSQFRPEKCRHWQKENDKSATIHA